MLCAFAYSSRKTRAELSKHRALDAYLSLVASGEGGASSARALRAVAAVRDATASHTTAFRAARAVP
jgi:hypothetical protein